MSFQEVSEPAAEALVNLSQDSNLAAEMVRNGLVKMAMEVLYKPESSITRLLVMLLVNLTQLDAGSASLLQVPFSSLVLAAWLLFIIFLEKNCLFLKIDFDCKVFLNAK